MSKTRTRTQFLTQFAILLAILAIFCFTPLGSIPIGPIVATLAMIPVIIAGMMMGIGAGAAMGAFAGLFSFIVMSFLTPNPITAFIFTPLYPPGNGWSLVICFVPRILVGVVAAAACKGFTKKFPKSDLLRFGVSGMLGSLTNTVLVLGGVWLFFGDAYADVIGAAITYIISITVLTNGIPEAIVSFLVGYAVCKPLSRVLGRSGGTGS